MIQGEVNNDRLAVVPLRLVSREDKYIDEIAVIDTFFSGYLSLPLERIRSLNWPFAERRSYSIADDTLVNFDLYEGTVFWNEEKSAILIVAAEGPPTIGMGLLYGSWLTIDVVDGGRVTIS